MAIKHKRKNSSGYTWQSSDLAEGQIGLNIADGTLHFKKSDNSVVTVDPEAAGGITDVVSDTTPQLGGDLDVAGNAIVSIDNGNIEITPNGTGQINLGLTNLTAYKETIHNGGSASSEYTPNYSNGSVHTVTLTGNVTFAAPTNMPVGASLTLILTQDGTGGRTGTWNASYKWMGGTPILSLANGAIDVINIFYDGTNYISGASKQESSAGGASEIDDLTDVTISSPSTGQVLTYTMSGQWENQNAPSGGITQVVEDMNPTLGGNLDVADYEITNTITDGHITVATNGSGNIYLDTDTGIVSASSNIETSGDVKGANLVATFSSGDEGGEIKLAQATTNSTLGGDDVTIDVFQNKLRIFESGGDFRGVYIDLSAAGNGVGTNLLSGGGISNVVEDTTPQLGGNLDANGNTIDMGANTITDTAVGNWNTAYGWGDHSTAGYQASLGFTAENSANKNQANGYVGLDGSSKISSTYLPSYVDDVLEYDDLASLPGTGESGKIYVTLDTNKTYRWSGSAYVEISASPGSTDAVTEGSTNLYFTTTRARNSFSAGTNITITDGVIASSGSSGLTDVVNDTTPQLGGALDVNGQSIVSVSNGNIVLEPNGTGDIYLTADTVRVGDANSNAVITTNGTGSLILNTANGANSGAIAINPDINGNIQISPNGTGGTVVKNLEYQEYVHALGTTSGTIAPNAANGNVQTITLDGNLTLNAFTSPVAGQSITLIVNTGGTGRTLTSTMKWAGGEKTLSTTNTTDIISVFYDGTNYFASLAKGFV